MQSIMLFHHAKRQRHSLNVIDTACLYVALAINNSNAGLRLTQDLSAQKLPKHRVMSDPGAAKQPKHWVVTFDPGAG